MEGRINFSLDEEGYVLDITVGRSRVAVAKELKNDVAVRVDPKTGEIVGIVILNFTKRFRTTKKPERIEIPIKATIKPLKQR